MTSKKMGEVLSLPSLTEHTAGVSLWPTFRLVLTTMFLGGGAIEFPAGFPQAVKTFSDRLRVRLRTPRIRVDFNPSG